MPRSTPLAQLDDQPVAAVITVRATLRSLQLKRTVLDQDWAILELEQSESTTTVLVFPKTLAAIPPGVLQPDAALRFDARVLRGTDGTMQLTPVSRITAV